jgi:large subunit ribosomal protein L15
LRRLEYTAVNVGDLDVMFDAGADVTPDALVMAGALRSAEEPFKVLAEGGVTKSLVVHAPRFSEAARQAIEGAGGKCVMVADDYKPAGLGRRHKRLHR